MNRPQKLDDWLKEQGSPEAAEANLAKMPEALKKAFFLEALDVEEIKASYEKQNGVLDKKTRMHIAMSTYCRRKECWGGVTFDLLGWDKETNVPSSNLLAYSSLFGIVDRKSDRPMFERKCLFSRNGTKLFYTGAALYQLDWDVLHALINLSGGTLNEAVIIKVPDVLRLLRWSRSGANLKLLKETIERLGTASLIVENDTKNNEFSLGKFCVFHLLKECQGIDHDVKIVIDERVIKLFGNNEYGLIDLEERSRLKKNDFAKKLQTLFANQMSNQQFHRFESLRKLANLTSDLKEFNRQICRALNLMIETKVIYSYWISTPKKGMADQKMLCIWKKEAPTEKTPIPEMDGKYVDSESVQDQALTLSRTKKREKRAEKAASVPLPAPAVGEQGYLF